MIDLNLDKESMLADIGAGATIFASPVEQPTDPAFLAAEEAYLVFEGKKSNHILPLIYSAVAKHFPEVPEEQLKRDIWYPLKKGLGNAYKWGNKKDPKKSIAVEVVVTKIGALISITDEGEGFDVANILGEFRDGEQYFTHGGSGFRHFRRAKSVITFADRGRTLLIRFLRRAEPGHALSAEEKSSLGLAADTQFMVRVFSESIAEFRDGGSELLSCKTYEESKFADEHSEVIYVLQYQTAAASEPQEMTLSGRLLPKVEAERDYAIAAQLSSGDFYQKSGIRIPEPVAVLGEPSMVLFRINPVDNIRTHLKKLTDFEKAAAACVRVADGLRVLHQSQVPTDVVSPEGDFIEAYHKARQGVTEQFARHRDEWVERLGKIDADILRHAGLLQEYQAVPIHGAIAWPSILYAGGDLYFYRFDASRYSHPGLDLGGFLADLARFYVLRDIMVSDWYERLKDAFLQTYFSESAPAWRHDLPFFIAVGLVLRLERLVKRPPKRWTSKINAYLGQLEALLQECNEHKSRENQLHERNLRDLQPSSA